MAAFRFEGFNPSGKREKGFIHADDLREATEKLRNRSFFITDIKEVAEKEKWKALSPKEVLLFTKELARLLEAGLPLFDSLITLEEKYRKHSCHPIIVTLCDSIKHGSSFSEALRKHPLSFDPLYLSMIENAEKTGSLVMALHELARLSSRSLNLKKQLLGSLLYPFLLLTFCFAILATLIFYVIPSLSDLFEGRRVHPLTGFILSISKALSSHVEIFIFSLLGLGFLFLFLFFSKKGKRKLQEIAHNMPFVGNLLHTASLVRFCRSAYALLHSGVPLLETLLLSKKVIGNPKLEAVLQEAEKHLLTGGKVSEILEKSSLFPPLFTRIFSLGELGGSLSKMLYHLAEIYEDDLEKHYTRLTQMAQPMILLFLGLVVGFVLLSVLLPLTDVSSFLDKQ